MRPSNISKNDRPSNIFKNNDNNNELNKTDNKNSIKTSNRETNSLKNKVEIKIIILEDVSVGKTNIMARYVNNSFTEDYRCSMQAEKQTKLIDVDLNTSVRMNIWDTVGQEKYRILLELL
jgi:GTPase SAR1 family protein